MCALPITAFAFEWVTGIRGPSNQDCQIAALSDVLERHQMAVVSVRTSNLEHAGGAFVDCAAAGADDETVALVGPPLNGRSVE